MAASQEQLPVVDTYIAGVPLALRGLFWKHIRHGDKDEAQLVACGGGDYLLI